MKSKIIFFLSFFAIFFLLLSFAEDSYAEDATTCAFTCDGYGLCGGDNDSGFCYSVDAGPLSDECYTYVCVPTSPCDSATSGCYTTCSATADTCSANNGTCIVSYNNLGSGSTCITHDVTVSCTANACSSGHICYGSACIVPPPCTGGGVCDDPDENCIIKEGSENTCAADNGTCSVNFNQLGSDQGGYSACTSHAETISCTKSSCEEHYGCDSTDQLCHPVYDDVDCPDNVKCMAKECALYSYGGVCTNLDEGICECGSNAPFACVGTCLDPATIDDTKFEFGGPCKTYDENTKYKCAVVDTAIGDVPTNPAQFVKRVYSLVLGMAGGIALILIMISGYRYMTSQGNPEAAKAASEQLTSAIVGLVFIILSFVILQVIGVDILKIPGFG